ncbi:ETC complex I subunit-like protein [Mesorhizobium sp. J18]|uniref:NADH dehydrogenase ubiquinone Fe-S protein 4 n=1 Tax=Mesorhizobium sp. J18 TaxID=935263 RepID=UPI00119C37BC|nr:NADH dehydrogenase ubiquinone Fe-S protein 4 [Mesorhizobium sp. J18]TWG97923.1 ETC complex I subunit-like protein [Mesorhizobium sp. J18]
MEKTRQVNRSTTTPIAQGWPSNDNRHKPLSMGRSIFPADAVARIYKPSRAMTTSGTARTKGWRLVFERRTAPFIEPLMGYTGGDDTLIQIELSFPTLQSAVRYAERQGLTFVVEGVAEQIRPKELRAATTAHSFSDATLEKLGLKAFKESYGRALAGAVNQNDPLGSGTWASPMDVVADTRLSLDAKRSILMNWAWSEYLIDQATNEGMPENNRPSRLDEVEQALLALECKDLAGQAHPKPRKADEVQSWIHSSSLNVRRSCRTGLL